jgi:hypothetical protein
VQLMPLSGRADQRSPTAPSAEHTVGVTHVSAALQIGVIVLVSVAVLAALVVVWRDDHKFVDDHKWRASR